MVTRLKAKSGKTRLQKVRREAEAFFLRYHFPNQFVEGIEEFYRETLATYREAGSFSQGATQLEAVSMLARQLGETLAKLNLPATAGLGPPVTISPTGTQITALDQTLMPHWLDAGGTKILASQNVDLVLGENFPMRLNHEKGILRDCFNPKQLEALAHFCEMKAEDLRERQMNFNGLPNSLLAVAGPPRKKLLVKCMWVVASTKDAARLATLIHELVTQEEPDRQWLRNELKELSVTPA